MVIRDELSGFEKKNGAVCGEEKKSNTKYYTLPIKQEPQAFFTLSYLRLGSPLDCNILKVRNNKMFVCVYVCV